MKNTGETSIYLMGKKVFTSYPEFAEINLLALENGTLKLNWLELLGSKEDIKKTIYTFELKIIVYGKLISSISFTNYEGIRKFLSDIDKGTLNFNWLEILKMAKDESYATKLSFSDWK